MAQTSRRETIWLYPDSSGDIDVHSEDDMLAIEAVTRSGDVVEVFIDCSLFEDMRGVMDSIEGKESNAASSGR
jgi:hypothetical protein